MAEFLGAVARLLEALFLQLEPLLRVQVSGVVVELKRQE